MSIACIYEIFGMEMVLPWSVGRGDIWVDGWMDLGGLCNTILLYLR